MDGTEHVLPFNAIARFPRSHPKVAVPENTAVHAAGDPYCGPVPPFTRIPAVSRWRWRWDQEAELRAPAASPPPCHEMSGAEVFYAYHAPFRWSANPGRAVPGVTSVYMIVDEALRAYMILSLIHI